MGGLSAAWHLLYFWYTDENNFLLADSKAIFLDDLPLDTDIPDHCTELHETFLTDVVLQRKSEQICSGFSLSMPYCLLQISMCLITWEKKKISKQKKTNAFSGCFSCIFEAGDGYFDRWTVREKGRPQPGANVLTRRFVFNRTTTKATPVVASLELGWCFHYSPTFHHHWP